MQCVQILITVPNAPAAVAVDGLTAGEAPQLLTLPANGVRYLSAEPLRGESRCYGVTRRVEFSSGRPVPQANGMALFDWGHGLFEAELWCGELPAARERVFPFTLAQRPYESMNAVLYYDDGLWLSLEAGRRALAGFALGDGDSGTLLSLGRLLAAIGTGAAAGRDTARVIAPDRSEAAFFSADRITGENGQLVVEEELHTRRGHVRRTVYGAVGTGLAALSAAITAQAAPPADADIPMALCEALLYGLTDEATGYLAPSLAAELTAEQIRAFFGTFTAVRSFPAGGGTVGLVGEAGEGVFPVRRIEFEMDGAQITNITEDA